MSNITTQRNDNNVAGLTPDFQGRYEPNFSWALAPAMSLMLPHLRGFWPFSSIDENNDAYDLSGQGRVLTNNSVSPVFGFYNLAHYADLTPLNNDYFSRPTETGLEITGALALGGWFWLDTLAQGNDAGLMGKWEVLNDQSYVLDFNDANNTFRFSVSGDGAAVTSVTGAVATANAWYHVAGVYVPGNYIRIYVNGVMAENAVAIPAPLFNTATEFTVGAYGAGTNFLNGRACLCWLCADVDPLTDTIIKTHYQYTRALFGVGA